MTRARVVIVEERPRVVVDEDTVTVTVTGNIGGGSPSGPAGGVLGGTYPDPSFAADMATQAELDAETSARSAADSAHVIDTTAIHGIADTALLETAAGAQAKVDAHVNDAVDAHDASAVSAVDAGGYFTGNDLEAITQELGADVGSLPLVWDGSDYQPTASKAATTREKTFYGPTDPSTVTGVVLNPYDMWMASQ